MFGALAFMLHGNMAVALALSSAGDLMVRVGTEEAEAALARPHARVAQIGQRTMKGWVLVDSKGLETRRQLGAWVGRGLQFARSLPVKR